MNCLIRKFCFKRGIFNFFLYDVFLFAALVHSVKGLTAKVKCDIQQSEVRNMNERECGKKMIIMISGEITTNT